MEYIASTELVVFYNVLTPSSKLARESDPDLLDDADSLLAIIMYQQKQPIII